MIPTSTRLPRRLWCRQSRCSHSVGRRRGGSWHLRASSVKQAAPFHWAKLSGASVWNSFASSSNRRGEC